MAAALLGSLFPGLARAWPVNGAVDLVAGSEVFVRQRAQAVQVDDPEVLAAELLPSGELLLTPKKLGRALLFLLSESGIDAVRVRVREVGGKISAAPLDEAALAAARKECPGLKLDQSSRGPELEASIATGSCRRAMLKVLQADDWAADRLDLTFHAEALQEQLAAMREALSRRGLGQGLELGYVGATLRLQGRLDPRRRAEVLGALFDACVGRLNFDDQTEGASAGAAPAAERREPRAREAPPLAPREATASPPERPRGSPDAGGAWH